MSGTLTFGVRSLEDFLYQELPDIPDEELVFTGAKYDYPSYEAMHRALSPIRLAIIRAMLGQGPLSSHDIAHRVGREFQDVQHDLSFMFSQGLLYKSEDGRMVFPYERIRFDFELDAVASAA